MQMTMKFKLSSLNRYKSQMLQRNKKTVAKYITNMADFVLAEAQYNLTDNPDTKAFDTGALAGSGVAREEGDKATVGFGGEDAKDYVLAIEFGTMPGHHPPVEPLIKWAKRVGIPKPEKVAWAIAKTIEKNGLRARPFLGQAVEKAFKEAPRIWKEAFNS